MQPRGKQTSRRCWLQITEQHTDTFSPTPNKHTITFISLETAQAHHRPADWAPVPSLSTRRSQRAGTLTVTLHSNRRSASSSSGHQRGRQGPGGRVPQPGRASGMAVTGPPDALRPAPPRPGAAAPQWADKAVAAAVAAAPPGPARRTHQQIPPHRGSWSRHLPPTARAAEAEAGPLPTPLIPQRQARGAPRAAPRNLERHPAGALSPPGEGGDGGAGACRGERAGAERAPAPPRLVSERLLPPPRRSVH